jgi:hypothetical protein
VVLHQQRRPNIPLIPTPALGFWPPVPLVTTFVPTVHPSHVDAAADFDRCRVKQLAATIPQESIAVLILSYANIFATHEADLGSHDRASHRIDTGNAPPIKAKLRRTDPGDAQAIEATVKTSFRLG